LISSSRFHAIRAILITRYAIKGSADAWHDVSGGVGSNGKSTIVNVKSDPPGKKRPVETAADIREKELRPVKKGKKSKTGK